MRQILSTGMGVDSVFALNNQMVIGAIKAVCETGLRIHEDKKAIGFDTIFVASIVGPVLIIVNVPDTKLMMLMLKCCYKELKILR